MGLDLGEIDAIVIDAMHRIWQKGATYREDTDAKAQGWIIKIARNLGMDAIRVKRKAQEVETELDDERIGTKALGNTIDETSIDLARLLQSLSPREKEVADLLSKGYRDVDIAEVLGISKTRVHQIRKAIGTKLSNQQTDEEIH